MRSHSHDAQPIHSGLRGNMRPLSDPEEGNLQHGPGPDGAGGQKEQSSVAKTKEGLLLAPWVGFHGLSDVPPGP